MSELGQALLGQLRSGGECVMADLGEAILARRLGELLESREKGEEEFLKVARVFTGFMLARAQRQRVEVEKVMKLRVKSAKCGKKKGMTEKESQEFKERIKLI